MSPEENENGPQSEPIESNLKEVSSPEIINSNSNAPNLVESHSDKKIKSNKKIQNKEKFYNSFNISIGRIKDGIATLLSEDLNLLEMPISILPSEIRKGNILKITIERNIEEEENRRNEIIDLQKNLLEDEILFLKNSENV